MTRRFSLAVPFALALAAALGACSSDGGPTAPDPSPAITSVTPNPIHASALGGSETPFTVGYTDPDGDILFLRVVEVSDPDNAINGGEVPVDDLATGTAGTFMLSASCNQVPPTRCQSGTVLVDFILIDAAGNESEPFRVTIVFE